MSIEDSDKKDSREALLCVAGELFSTKGYNGVSTRELADKAGVNLGAIAYHFNGKAGLFVETIHRLMQGEGCLRAKLPLEGRIDSPVEAAQALSDFIRSFLGYLLRPDGASPCRLMFREILTDPEANKEVFEILVSTIVSEYFSPLLERLGNILQILAPALEEEEQKFYSQSILGQCTFYVTHRPFLERLWERDFSQSPLFEETAHHIVRFTLRSLGCDPALMTSLLREKTTKSTKKAKNKIKVL